jgi:hypothetical protein
LSDKHWALPVVDAGDGELGIEFPDEILDRLQLAPGDVIIWEEINSGTWSFRKKDE